MKVLVVDEMHESIHHLLKDAGFEVDYNPTLDYESTKGIIKDYDALFIRSKFFIDEAFLENKGKLKCIGRAGAGLDLIDIEACERKGIKVFGANEANSVAVAEHTLGMVLSLFNRITTARQELQSYKWLREGNRGEELYGKTVGIIGFGNNGSETARRFSAFGCKVLVYDKYKTGFGEGNIVEATMEQILNEVELLSLHIPLTLETKRMINASFLEKFQQDIYFCNLARGEVTDYTALVDAIRSGKIKGACLDVFENEKLKKLTAEQDRNYNFLVNHPRVLMTPHVAGWTVESYRKINEVLVTKLQNLL